MVLKLSIALLGVLFCAQFTTGKFGALLGNVIGGGGGSSNAKSFSAGIDLDTWVPPDEIIRLFPYYISGVDRIGQPVWVIEFGKWNIRKYFEDGGDIKIAEIYVDQMFYRWNKAENIFYNYWGGTGSFGLIVDFGGYNLRQIVNGPALRFTLRMTRKFQSLPAEKLAYGNLINTNRVANTLVNVFLKPILAETFARMETSGVDSKTWIPLLLRRIPKTSLPPWYGGYQGHRPIVSFG